MVPFPQDRDGDVLSRTKEKIVSGNLLDNEKALKERPTKRRKITTGTQLNKTKVII